MTKYFMSKKLSAAIIKIPEINKELRIINPEEYGPRSRPIFDKIQKLGEKYFTADQKLRNEWLKFINTIKPEFGLECERNVVAAAILAGAAISKNNIQIRPDLSKSIIEQREMYLKNKSNLTPFARDISTMYQKLKINNAFDQAINKLLTDKERVLPLGWRLHKLDVVNLEASIKEYFGQKKKYDARGIGAIKKGEENRFNIAWANENIKLTLDNFKCLEPQEKSDEIFWVVTLRHLKNIEQVYNQIEKNINKDEFELTGLEWEEKTWQSDLFTDIKKGAGRNLKYDVLNLKMHKGIILWSASLMCIENDDEEYQAIQDTCDSISQYAGYIRRGASIVVTVSGGVSPVAIGAAIVQAGAGAVEITAKVVSAIVGIVNYFDENDIIDTKILKNEDDYAKDNQNEIKNPDVINKDELFKESPGKAQYNLRYNIELTGRTSFNRAWRIRTIIQQGTEVSKKKLLVGGSWDIPVKFKFPEKIQQIIDASVDYNLCDHRPKCSPICRHAHWKPKKSYPKLLSDKQTVEGIVHAGTRGSNEIIFTPRATGRILIKRL